MNSLQSAIRHLRSTKSGWSHPGGFTDHLLEDIEHRLQTVRIRCTEEERRALRDAAEDVNYAIVRESVVGGRNLSALVQLRQNISRLAVAL